MVFKKRANDATVKHELTRSERFIERCDGIYVNTREGLEGPYDSLASALTGLMKAAERSRLPQYQMRLLYQSICEKALQSCD